MFDYKSQKSSSILPGMMWAANFSTTWSCCILTLGNKVLSALLCLCPELNPYYTFNCLWALLPGRTRWLVLGMLTCPARSASISQLPCCRWLCVWGWIRGFDRCICFLLCHIHNWQVQPAGYSRRKSSVPGMQNHRFLRLSSLCTLHSYPSFPVCSKHICRL